MRLAYLYCELGRSARSDVNIRIRQPLSVMYIKNNKSDICLSSEYKSIIMDELNVKNIIESSDINQYMTYSLRPQLKNLGPKYNKLVGGIRVYLSSCDAKKVVETVNKGETFIANIDGNTVEFTKDDLLISTSQNEGYTGASDESLSVVLNTTITRELTEEYYCREFVSKVQALRKVNNFDIVARINVQVQGGNEIIDVLIKNQEQLKEDIFMSSLTIGDSGKVTEEFNIDGHIIVVSISE